MNKTCVLQESLKANDEDLKTLWCSLFNLDSFPILEVDELQDVALLFSTALMLFKKQHSKLKTAESQYSILKDDLQASKLEINDLKQEVNRLNQEPCQNCLVLEEEVDKYAKKLKAHESRIQSIANILNIQHTELTGPEEQNPTERAFNLVSQMLLGGADVALPTKRRRRHEFIPTKLSLMKSPKKKRADADGEQNLKEKDLLNLQEFTEIQGTNSSQGDCKVLAANGVVISETLCMMPEVSELPFVDKKESHAAKNECVSVVSLDSPDLHSGTVSPVISNTPKKQSMRLLKNVSSTDTRKSPCEKISGDCETNAALKNEGFVQVPTACSLQQPSKSKHEKKADFWNLKPKHSVDYQTSSAGGSKQSRRLKQTQLSVGCFSKRTDIGSLEEFNAGIRKTSTQFSKKMDTDVEDDLLRRAIQESLKYSQENRYSTSEDDDIILESPNASQGKKMLPLQPDKVNRICDTDITVFVPVSKLRSPDSAVPKTSVVDGKNKSKNESLAENIAKDTSFDRPPQKPSKSPNYKYRQGTVRKKELRQALEGWECDMCQKYYESGDNSEAEKRHMNHCSRHRNKYPVRAKTPPGFWDPDFPTTQECRNKMLDITQACKITKNKGKRAAK